MSAAVPNPEILLRLSAVPRIGPTKIRALVAHFGFSEEIFTASTKELSRVIGIKTAENLKKSDGRAFARSQLKRLQQADARLVSFWDKDYPELLKQIYDPPPYIFIKGSLKPEDRFSIAVVGTRRPSRYGRVMAEKLASELVTKGLTVVSGLAFGVDTIAHEAALKEGGRTFAVLGSGVDVIYPPSNRGLAEKIVDSGALISEFPMGAKPDRTNFPQRNRLISGLSLGTLIIEAGAKSGALITASLAIEQNRDVFALPGNINSPNSFGTNELIKQGAKMVTSIDDVLEELRPHLDGFLYKETPKIDLSRLNEDEKKTLALLNHQPKHIDRLAREVGGTTAGVLAILLALELKGLVKQLPGTQFIRI